MGVVVLSAEGGGDYVRHLIRASLSDEGGGVDVELGSSDKSSTNLLDGCHRRSMTGDSRHVLGGYRGPVGADSRK